MLQVQNLPISPEEALRLKAWCQSEAAKLFIRSIEGRIDGLSIEAIEARIAAGEFPNRISEFDEKLTEIARLKTFLSVFFEWTEKTGTISTTQVSVIHGS